MKVEMHRFGKPYDPGKENERKRMLFLEYSFFL